MTLPLVWVVGAGGLLGAPVLRELGADGWRPEQPFAWGDATRLGDQFRSAVRTFAARLASEPGRSWAIAWCAGAGVVGTSAAALDAETATFRQFLELLSLEPNLALEPGHFLLASSAGGVYGGSFVCPINEGTPPQPISAYGRTKLLQEQILGEWALRQVRPIRTLVARFANLYGPEQRLEKPQGLISHLSRSLIYNAPVHIYVSLDTIRDYLFAEDAGRRLVAGLGQLAREASAVDAQVTKVYASEREISIAGLLGVFRQLGRRRLRVVSGLHPVGALQPRRLQFRSQVWAGPIGRQVELIEGVSHVYRRQLSLFQQGVLPPPAPRR